MSKGYDEISKQGWLEDAHRVVDVVLAGAAAVALANAAWRLNVADLAGMDTERKTTGKGARRK